VRRSCLSDARTKAIITWRWVPRALCDLPARLLVVHCNFATLAPSRSEEAEIHIRLVSLSGGSDHESTVKGWPNVSGLDWAPDGKAFYVGSVSPQSRTLLYVDLKGSARVLWQLQGNRLLYLGCAFARRPLPRHTGERQQQQRVDAGRLLRAE
jgi:hypothetical protein